jgi:hypothetical protein
MPLAATGATAPPPVIELASTAFGGRFDGNDIWDSSYLNGWAAGGEAPTTRLVPEAPGDIRVHLTRPGASWTEGSNTGWNHRNDDSWTFETRLKFHAVPAGYILWLGTDTQRILVEIHSDRTQDFGGGTFRVEHGNLDGAIHRFRVAHDAGAQAYHVWRDGTRLTPSIGVPYDGAAADSRLIMGDFTRGPFGNNCDVEIDYVRYDQSGAYLPAGADVDGDGMPDAWEHRHFGGITSADPSSDDDGDASTNLEEFAADTDPKDENSRLSCSIETAVPSGVRITIPDSSPRRRYTLHVAIDLGRTAPWSGAVDPVTGNDGDLVFDHSPDGTQFYRVGVALP